MNGSLTNQLILITGAARRLGRIFALACAHAGADIIIHHGHSPAEAETLRQELLHLGRRAEVIEGDLSKPHLVKNIIQLAGKFGSLTALVNSAAIFKPLSPSSTQLDEWEQHLTINLTAPFLLSQAFASQVPRDTITRIVNILDWRALRPSADHFPYTVSKAALASMTRSLAVAYAPNILVNGLALGAILPPSDRQVNPKLLEQIPAGRWAKTAEVESSLLFLLSGPEYITGEILHVDGGRHLV